MKPEKVLSQHIVTSSAIYAAFKPPVPCCYRSRAKKPAPALQVKASCGCFLLQSPVLQEITFISKHSNLVDFLPWGREEQELMQDQMLDSTLSRC